MLLSVSLSSLLLSVFIVSFSTLLSFLLLSLSTSLLSLVLCFPTPFLSLLTLSLPFPPYSSSHLFPRFPLFHSLPPRSYSSSLPPPTRHLSLCPLPPPYFSLPSLSSHSLSLPQHSSPFPPHSSLNSSVLSSAPLPSHSSSIPLHFSLCLPGLPLCLLNLLALFLFFPRRRTVDTMRSCARESDGGGLPRVGLYCAHELSHSSLPWRFSRLPHSSSSSPRRAPVVLREQGLHIHVWAQACPPNELCRGRMTCRRAEGRETQTERE